MKNTELIEELFKEIRVNYHLLKHGAGTIHQKGKGTAGIRALLELLSDNLSTGGNGLTVSHIAKLRYVTRQSVQTLVNQMLELGLVESVVNPFHRTSVIIKLTDVGIKEYKKMKDQERHYITKLNLDMPSKKIEEIRNSLSEINFAISNFLSKNINSD